MVLSASELPEEGFKEGLRVVGIPKVHSETRQIHHIIHCAHLSPCLAGGMVHGLKLHVQGVHLMKH